MSNYISVLRSTIRRLTSRQGVIGVIIMDREGFTLETSLSTVQSEQISAHIGTVINRVLDVVNAGQSVKNLKKNNIYSMGSLKEISINLETMELLIIPNQEIGYSLVLLQNLR